MAKKKLSKAEIEKRREYMKEYNRKRNEAKKALAEGGATEKVVKTVSKGKKTVVVDVPVVAAVAAPAPSKGSDLDRLIELTQRWKALKLEEATVAEQIRKLVG